MRPDVERWLQRRTSSADDWPADAAAGGQGRRTPRSASSCRARRGGHRRPDRGRRSPTALIASAGGDGLVDELVVLDSGSTDAHRGAWPPRPARPWCTATTCCRSVPALPGKGEALWRSLAATDRRRPGLRRRRPALVHARRTSPGCSGRCSPTATVALVKALYERPLRRRRRRRAAGRRRPGHRAGRPPAAQPALAGARRRRAAARRRVRRPARRCSSRCRSRPGTASSWRCSSTPWSWPGWTRSPRSTSGCGVHRHQTDARLGLMASEIMQVALARLERSGRLHRAGGPSTRRCRSSSAVDGGPAGAHPRRRARRAAARW